MCICNTGNVSTFRNAYGKFYVNVTTRTKEFGYKISKWGVYDDEIKSTAQNNLLFEFDNNPTLAK